MHGGRGIPLLELFGKLLGVNAASDPVCQTGWTRDRDTTWVCRRSLRPLERWHVHAILQAYMGTDGGEASLGVWFLLIVFLPTVHVWSA